MVKLSDSYKHVDRSSTPPESIRYQIIIIIIIIMLGSEAQIPPSGGFCIFQHLTIIASPQHLYFVRCKFAEKQYFVWEDFIYLTRIFPYRNLKWQTDHQTSPLSLFSCSKFTICRLQNASLLYSKSFLFHQDSYNYDNLELKLDVESRNVVHKIHQETKELFLGGK